MIDVLILTKDEDGSVDADGALGHRASSASCRRSRRSCAELLAEEDVEHLAAAMEPGSTAGVLIWENLWAAPVRGGGAALGWPADRERTDPHPGDHRLDRGR